MSKYTHGLDFPTPAKDAFTQAQLSMLPPAMRDRMKIHFCGPTGANAVDAAMKLCKIATGRGDIVSFQGGFHGSSHAAMAVTGPGRPARPGAQRRAGRSLLPVLLLQPVPAGSDPGTAARPTASTYLERSLKDSNGGIPLPGGGDRRVGAGRGRRDPRPTRSSCDGCAR